MGLRSVLGILYAICICLVTASEDVEFKDPYLLEVAEFTASDLLKQEQLQLGNRTSHKILDAQILAFPQPTVCSFKQCCYFFY